MDIDTQRIRALLDKRDAIDAELANALTGKKQSNVGIAEKKGTPPVHALINPLNPQFRKTSNPALPTKERDSICP